MTDIKLDTSPLPRAPVPKEKISQVLLSGRSIATDDRSVFELAQEVASEQQRKTVFIPVTKDNFAANMALDQISDQVLPPEVIQQLINEHGESRWHKDMWVDLSRHTALYFSNVVVFVEVQEGVTVDQSEYAKFSLYLRGTRDQLEENGAQLIL